MLQMMSVMTCMERTLIKSAFSRYELMRLPIMNKLDTTLYVRQYYKPTLTIQLFL